MKEQRGSMNIASILEDILLMFPNLICEVSLDTDIQRTNCSFRHFLLERSFKEAQIF